MGWKVTRTVGWKPSPSRPSSLALRLDQAPGKWFDPVYQWGSNSSVVIADRLYAVAFHVPIGMEYEWISAWVTLANAGNGRIGIYDDLNGLPGNLIVDAGAFDTGSVGGKVLPLEERLPAGWYWLASIFSAVPRLTKVYNQASLDLLGIVSLTTTARQSAPWKAQAYGALPASFGTPDGYELYYAPRVMLFTAKRGMGLEAGWRSREGIIGPDDQIEDLSAHARSRPLSGFYYFNSLNVDTLNNQAPLVADTLYGTPLMVPYDTTYDRIGINVSALPKVGMEARLGIYADGGGYPGDLILDAGTVSEGAIAGVEIVINEALSKDWYWLALLSESNPYVRSCDAPPPGLHWLGFDSGLDTDLHLAISASQAWGALPDPFPGGGTYMVGDTPRIMVRVE